MIVVPGTKNRFVCTLLLLVYTWYSVIPSLLILLSTYCCACCSCPFARIRPPENVNVSFCQKKKCVSCATCAFVVRSVSFISFTVEKKETKRACIIPETCWKAACMHVRVEFLHGEWSTTNGTRRVLALICRHFTLASL